MSEKKPIVIDVGTYNFKVGFSGDKYTTFPSMYGEDKRKVIVGKKLFEDENEGGLSKEECDSIMVKSVLERGIVKNIEKFNKLLEYTFEDVLHVSPNEHKIFLTERPKNPKENREKIIESLFEKYGAPSIYIGNQQVLSLYASNLTNGIVIDSGEGITSCVPVFEGYSFPNAVENINVSGIDVSNIIAKELVKENPNHSSIFSSFYNNESTVTNMKIIKEIKEKLSFVPIDYHKEILELQQTENQHRQSFKLPDGKEIKLNNQILLSGDVLFNPNLVNPNENLSLVEATIQSINKCDEIIQNSLYNNIVIAGGSTLFNGFVSRLKEELLKTVPKNVKINLIAPLDRDYSSWIGGSILTSHSSMEKLYVTKNEYLENGPSIIHKKCL
ncbi:hypothetical protein DICPUDRAFT_78745 [Dictyostelium purpureum]|uniref:Actin n=1 Tax=Dictyostelium purpureum TaxID=5786 RepID=F0ZKF6_DICPU|nr:uncharacterized protein DICPUDRAFT_78745 [Dictyostelium purpureum]EGC35600.1 hypothetical protein DICPUDRAFT_78745 [Dictyostelium purpureum]|eukprot:XP_003287903.1 hypothetical protein DICPUDRAFT_78745 [Dictyostelium purpureum]